MEDSFITLHRKFLKWEWYTEPKMCQLFIYFLLSATHIDTRFKGIELKRGQLLTGLKSINKNTGISSQSARTCIKRLKSTGEITVQSTSLYSIITICKYNDYQNKKNKSTVKSTGEITNDQQATNNIQQYNKETKERVRPLVLLFPVEIEKLKTLFGKSYDWALDEIENHKQKKGAKYKSDYHALIGWVYKKAIQEKIIFVKIEKKEAKEILAIEYFPDTTK
jgi:hypothetical protein